MIPLCDPDRCAPAGCSATVCRGAGIASNDEMFAHSYDWYVAHREEVFGRTDASHHRSPVKQGVLAAVSVALSVAR